MNAFKTVNILDLIDLVGEEEIKKILSDFSCEKNMEIELFVGKNAIDFSKKKISVTYLVFNEEMELAAIFALTHKAIQITNEGISKSAQKKIQRFAQLDECSNSYIVSAFLIAQFGKNSNYSGKPLSGNYLMRITEEVLSQIQRAIGGGIVYLECEEKENLLKFYQSNENGYRIFDDRFSLIDNTKYIQLFKFL